MEYEILLDYRALGYQTWFWIKLGLVALAVSLAFYLVPRLFGGSSPPSRAGLLSRLWYVAFSLIFLIGTIAMSIHSYNKITTAFDNEDYKVVEGPVNDIVVEEMFPVTLASFKVGDLQLSFDNVFQPSLLALVTDPSDGISEGDTLRIAYVTWGSDIVVRLERRK